MRFAAWYAAKSGCPVPAGRKPKPTALKKLSGNAGKRKINKQEPVAKIGMPDRPASLKGEALKEWNRVVPLLFQMGLLTHIDRACLEGYCVAYGRAKQADAFIEKHKMKGLFYENANGNVIQHPAVGISSSSWKAVQSFADRFGMNPSERSRMRVDCGFSNTTPQNSQTDGPTRQDQNVRMFGRR